ncbi:MAG TPA: metalloregulator ArsR/SmtB family transcription factor [Candidatus Binataceae bacterium]|nr:metalloregulator ArsR/SmtB family transcription factor [Candidatus Binataceae bacterium]
MNASVQPIIRRQAKRPRPALPREAVEMVAARFRAMGEPMRLQILQQLESGESSVSALAENLGATQPNVSKHLKVLQDAGLLSRRQQGNSVYYAIADPLVLELCDMICSRLHDRLEAQVGALKPRVKG